LSGAPASQIPLVQRTPAFAINNPACTQAANTPALFISLKRMGCYVKGSTVLISACQREPSVTLAGHLPRLRLQNWDVSVVKDEKFKERLTAPFRAEFFNVLTIRISTIPRGRRALASTIQLRQAPSGAAVIRPTKRLPNPVLGRRKPFDPVGLETDLVPGAFRKRKDRFKIGPSLFSPTRCSFSASRSSDMSIHRFARTEQELKVQEDRFMHSCSRDCHDPPGAASCILGAGFIEDN